MNVLDWGPVNWLDLRGAVAFHLTFHRSRAIHVNHLFFLHTYVWGMFLLSSACHPWFAVLLAGVLVVYGGLLTRRARWYVAAVYFGLVCALCGSALSFSHAQRHGMLSGSRTRADRSPFLSSMLNVEAPGGMWGPGAALGTVVALLSFGCQLAGHALHERLVSPPRLFHGFIAASPLEVVAFFLRLGVPVAACVDGPALWAEVYERRRAALHGPALSTRSG